MLQTGRIGVLQPLSVQRRKVKFMKPKSGREKNCKSSALRFQGCCGIVACVMAAGKRLLSSSDAERYRKLFLENVSGCRKPKNWMGGTHDWERALFLEYLGVKHKDVTPQTPGVLTLKSLLCSRSIYQTHAQFIVTVTEHCFYMKTAGTKHGLYCVDQRGVKMHLGSEELQRDIRKHVDSVWRVSVAKRDSK